MKENNINSISLKKGLGIGENFPTRVNLNFGLNRTEEYRTEKEKIDTLLFEKKTRPDITMDLSTIKVNDPIYKSVINEHNIPVGIVPVYICHDSKSGIEKSRFFDELNEFAENGISFFTLHFTANRDLLNIAKSTRKIPITSRGGAVLLYDQILNNKDNILLENIDSIISICKSNNIAISLGTSFRPSSIFDACDSVHIKETTEQLKICEYLKSRGVKVMVENVGHISIDKLEEHCNLLRKFKSPIMPLGPLPTDSGFENDHIVSAVGASIMGYNNCAHIINCVTKKEHLSSEITLADMQEGISAAKVAAHMIDVSKGIPEAIDIDKQTYFRRSVTKNCLLSDVDCLRCSTQCPLKLV